LSNVGPYCRLSISTVLSSHLTQQEKQGEEEDAEVIIKIFVEFVETGSTGEFHDQAVAKWIALIEAQLEGR
jgi:hypothetical protein